MSTNKRVVVIGGGLAGMAAAVALESAGINVTLLEARKTLGGRAGSFVHPETGEILDNCQHVLLGCCTNLIDFYRRLGVLERIRFERTIHFADGRGDRHDLWGAEGLPAPLHLGMSMLRFKALNTGERIALARAMLTMMELGKQGRELCANQSFGDWLKEHDQPKSLIDKIYQSLITGALNEDCYTASAKYAIQVFQDSLLANSRGYFLGLPNCPLGELYGQLPCGDVRLGERVSRIVTDAAGISPSLGTPGEGRGEGSSPKEVSSNSEKSPHPLPEYRESGQDSIRVIGVELTSGEIIACDDLILATNYDAVTRFVNSKDDPRIGLLENLSSTPILGAHLFFDVPILSESHVAFLEGPLQWLFKKDTKGKALHGVISAANEWVNRDRDEMADLFARQIWQTLPAAATAKLLRSVIVIEKRATFAPLPDVDRWRPTQSPSATGIQNLYLAGDYTQTGWPATMEGAVRSGYLAAESLLSRRGIRSRFVVDDLPVQWPAKLLAAMGKR